MSMESAFGNRRRLPRRIMIIALVVLLVFVGLIINSLLRRVPVNVVTASGTIEATEVVVSAKVAGRITVSAVDEGSQVDRGDLIARLESAELRAAVTQARAALQSARARYNEALAGTRPEQIQQARAQVAAAEAAVSGAQAALENAREAFHRSLELRAQVESARARVRQSEAAVRQAEEALQLARAGARAEQIRQAEAAVDQARTAYEQAQRDARRARTLHDQGAISRQQLEQAETAADVARERLSQAQAQLADIRAGARPEEIAQAQAVVAQARANLQGAQDALRTAEEAYRTRIQARQAVDAAESQLRVARAQRDAAYAQLELALAGTRAEQIEQARGQVEQARGALQQAQAVYANTTIRAPIGGVVVTKTAEQGELVTPGAPIVTLANLEEVWLRVYIPENLYGRIRLNQRVNITVDAYPNIMFRGHVSEIASRAEFTPKNIQTREERVTQVFGVKITLPNPRQRLKPGMPADAVIRLPL